MMHTSDGTWKPSFDYPLSWRTRKAARRKKKELGEVGKIYEIARYDFVHMKGGRG